MYDSFKLETQDIAVIAPKETQDVGIKHLPRMIASTLVITRELESTPEGLMVLPSFYTLTTNSQTVTVYNASEKSIILPADTPIADLIIVPIMCMFG